jgi:nudix-type nucleoside diphosphatase (YffH/AdpP family)
MYKIREESKKNLFSNFVGVDEYHFFLEEQQTKLRRFVVTRPDAAAILLYNKDTNSLVLIKQFRAPVYSKAENGFILEIPAGVLEAGESPDDTMTRETLEETGYSIEKPALVYTFFPSPGMLNEKMHLFYAEVGKKDKVEAGGGLDSEKEFLEVVEIPVDECLEMLQRGQIVDAKTMLAIMHFHLKIKKA